MEMEHRPKSNTANRDCDLLWVATTTAAMFPVWGWAVAHSFGDPPYTVRLFSLVHRRFGVYGFIALPVVSVVFGIAYLRGVTAATRRLRQQPGEQQ